MAQTPHPLVQTLSWMAGLWGRGKRGGYLQDACCSKHYCDGRQFICLNNNNLLKKLLSSNFHKKKKKKIHACSAECSWTQNKMVT